MNISKIVDLADDVPYKAKVSVKYSLSQLFPKDAVSSMFPKNWSLERIKEEVAFVYEKAMKNSDLIKVKATGMSFGKIEGGMSWRI